MIYLFDDMENISDDIIRQTFPLMPPERQERALRYRHSVDRNLCIMAYWLLMYGLKREYGIETPPTFTYSESGKPSLAEHPDIAFNISHCRLGVVCAISKYEVGIDIQDVRPFDMDVAERVCTDDELRELAHCKAPEGLFCKLWTIKESFVKLLHSKGMAGPLNALEAHTIFEQLGSHAFGHWGSGYHLCCFGVENGALWKVDTT